MQLDRVQTFYRCASQLGAKVEDGCFVNHVAGLYGVADGASEAYSPKNPYLVYPNSLTAGQMAIREISKVVTETFSNEDLVLLEANTEILKCHRYWEIDPTRGTDAGGACFAFAKLTNNGINLIFGGDCFVVVQEKYRCTFLNGFDKAAFLKEEKDDAHFVKCCREAGGNIGKAWDLHVGYYREKRIFCANQHMGEGGFAFLNGDPAVANCWSRRTIPWSAEPKLVILGTDGLLPPSETTPDHYDRLGLSLVELYRSGGIDTIIKWRDAVEIVRKRIAHVEGHPEGSAVVLKFA